MPDPTAPARVLRHIRRGAQAQLCPAKSIVTSEPGLDLVVLELPYDMAPFAGPDKLPMGETYRMDRPLDLALPKLDELEEAGMVRGEVIVLPDKRVQDVLVIRDPVEELASGRAIAPEHHFGFREGICMQRSP